jgi:hypothetical protein
MVHARRIDCALRLHRGADGVAPAMQRPLQARSIRENFFETCWQVPVG